MKILLVGLLALGSISAFAGDCNITIGKVMVQSHDGAYRMYRAVPDSLEAALVKKGYIVVSNSEKIVDMTVKISGAKIRFYDLLGNEKVLTREEKIENSSLKEFWVHAPELEKNLVKRYLKTINSNHDKILKKIPECK